MDTVFPEYFITALGPVFAGQAQLCILNAAAVLSALMGQRGQKVITLCRKGSSPEHQGYFELLWRNGQCSALGDAGSGKGRILVSLGLLGCRYRVILLPLLHWISWQALCKPCMYCNSTAAVDAHREMEPIWLPAPLSASQNSPHEGWSHKLAPFSEGMESPSTGANSAHWWSFELAWTKRDKTRLASDSSGTMCHPQNLRKAALLGCLNLLHRLLAAMYHAWSDFLLMHPAWGTKRRRLRLWPSPWYLASLV